MTFDYKDDYANQELRTEKSLVEYENQANEAIIKARGEFPYDSVALVSGVYVVRCLLQRKDNGANISNEEIEKSCCEMF